jgi:hypothetical protein
MKREKSSEGNDLSHVQVSEIDLGDVKEIVTIEYLKDTPQVENEGHI